MHPFHLANDKLHQITPAAVKVDRKTIVLRITPAGVNKIQPVYDRYAKLCQEMLKDVPAEVRQTVL